MVSMATTTTTATDLRSRLNSSLSPPRRRGCSACWSWTQTAAGQSCLEMKQGFFFLWIQILSSRKRNATLWIPEFCRILFVIMTQITVNVAWFYITWNLIRIFLYGRISGFTILLHLSVQLYWIAKLETQSTPYRVITRPDTKVEFGLDTDTGQKRPNIRSIPTIYLPTLRDSGTGTSLHTLPSNRAVQTVSYSWPAKKMNWS